MARYNFEIFKIQKNCAQNLDVSRQILWQHTALTVAVGDSSDYRVDAV